MKYKQAINRLKTELEMDRNEMEYSGIMINKLHANISMMLESILIKKQTISLLKRTKPEKVAWAKLKIGHKHTNTKLKLIRYVNMHCKDIITEKKAKQGK